jgi:hypothetical protein
MAATAEGAVDIDAAGLMRLGRGQQGSDSLVEQDRGVQHRSSGR